MKNPILYVFLYILKLKFLSELWFKIENKNTEIIMFLWYKSVVCSHVTAE